MRTRRKKLIRLTAHSKTLQLLKGQLGYLQRQMDVVLVAKDTGNLKSLAESEGVEWRDVDIHREISLVNDLMSLYNLIKLFRKEKPDIVHANTPKGALLGLLAAKLTRVRHRIYNVNGLRFETASGNFRHLLIAMEKLACACATKVIPQSNGVADMLLREHITRKPLKVLLNGSGNGVDTVFFSPDIIEVKSQGEVIRGNDGKFVFVFVGRLVGDKGINELVEAFDRLHKEFPQTKLHLIGPREDSLDPISEVTSQIINDTPDIVEFGLQTDVRPYLAGADVFILPSYREGFPNVVLEASAMGLPCIVSDVNGATDAVKDGINGLIIPKKDSEALYAAMRRLLTDEDLRSQIASVTRNIVTERFSRPMVWDAVQEIYDNLE